MVRLVLVDIPHEIGVVRACGLSLWRRPACGDIFDLHYHRRCLPTGAAVTRCRSVYAKRVLICYSANVFFLMLSCMLISTIIAAPIGALLTQTSPWGASFLSFGIILFGTSGVLALPETLDRGLVVESEEDPGLRERLARAFEGGIKKTMARTLHLGRTCYKATAFIWHSRNITLLLFTFFIGHLGKQSVVVMVLYGSRKFGWSIGEVSPMSDVKQTLPLLTSFLGV
jgi:hypothetical protein